MNAFYRDLSQAKIQQAMEQFRQGGVMPGFVVIDDAVEIAQYGSTMLLPRGSVFKIR